MQTNMNVMCNEIRELKGILLANQQQPSRKRSREQEVVKPPQCSKTTCKKLVRGRVANGKYKSQCAACRQYVNDCRSTK